MPITSNGLTPLHLQQLASEYAADTGGLDDYAAGDLSGDKTAVTTGINAHIDALIVTHAAHGDVVADLTALKGDVENQIDTGIPASITIKVSDVLQDKIIVDVQEVIAADKPFICGMCNGIGTIPKNRYAGNPIDDDTIITCPTCEGAGRTEVEYKPQISVVAAS